MEMSLKLKMDVLDFIINVLRDHERTLDNICHELEQRLVSEGPYVTISTILSLLEYRAFETPSFSFFRKPNTLGDYVLIDQINNQKLIFGRSPAQSNAYLWNVNLFQVGEGISDKQLESHYFDSERMMLAWIIKYMLRAQK